MTEQDGPARPGFQETITSPLSKRPNSQPVPDSGDIFGLGASRWEAREQTSTDASVNRGKAETSPESRSIRVVVVKLSGHEQAVEVDQVEEIIIAPKVSRLIKAPFLVEGFMRLRGKIVPVVDLGKAMRISSDLEPTGEPVVVITRLWGRRIGFRVDSVQELLTISAESIEQPRNVLSGVDSRFMKGLTYLGDRLLAILDLEAMLSKDQEIILMDEQSLGIPEDSVQQDASREKRTTRRIISFVLDSEIFGADMRAVAEIKEMTGITPVPNVPEFVLGLINLRGDIIPVIDLRIIFGLGRKQWTDDSRIVIMKEKNLLVAIVVDSMWESLRLTEDDFQPMPHGGVNVDSQYLRDISVVNGRVVSVLNISRLLSDTSGRSYSEHHAMDLLATGSVPRLDSEIRGIK